MCEQWFYSIILFLVIAGCIFLFLGRIAVFMEKLESKMKEREILFSINFEQRKKIWLVKQRNRFGCFWGITAKGASHEHIEV